MMTMTIEAGKEYRIRGRRGKFAAVRPIYKDGEIAGWWMTENMRVHAFRLEMIKKGKK